ncbi:MAG: type I methionyl aminopeptidase [Leptospira sp.]|uniref:Methionine aminopeptidase n=1 Tax=Leptospira paudalimensis TaxID=2950024 RepID=A0ABT3MAH5_9LEPT|nr:MULTISPECIES: type I methionyl aminopeptidase [Leptospira]MBL0954849.1 type I methionyl aminopeptidase [Leptospira sp.]MCW7505386.1 type I methionyl aminopeptidase [Leptospira paudalimensis]
MSIQNEKDLQGILKAGKFVAKVRELLKLLAKPGVSTLELDMAAKHEFENAGAYSAPKFDYQFPGFTCISTNFEIAHGIPKKETILKEGDLVNVDVSAKLDGYYADTGISFIVGNTNPNLEKLCETAIEGTMRATKQAYTGNYLRNIGKEIHSAAKENGFTVIKNLAGHGTGKKLHEEPQVLVYEDKRDHRKLNHGLVLAIESFISTGSQTAFEEADGWTLVAGNRKGNLSYVAQCEHTVIVQNGKPIIATL